MQKRKEVLSYRTWEMRQEIEPKEDEIDFLKQEIYNIEKEFEKLLEDERLIAETEVRLKRSREGLVEQLAQQKQQTRERRLRIKRITDDIEAAVQSKNTDKKYYQEQMGVIYAQYVPLMSHNKRNNQNPRGVDEIERHIGHIDQEIDCANKHTDLTLKRREQEIQRTTQENADLIKELTSARD